MLEAVQKLESEIQYLPMQLFFHCTNLTLS